MIDTQFLNNYKANGDLLLFDIENKFIEYVYFIYHGNFQCYDLVTKYNQKGIDYYSKFNNETLGFEMRIRQEDYKLFYELLFDYKLIKG